jgi:hypothetical protein
MIALAVLLFAHPPSSVPSPKPIELFGEVKEVHGGPGGPRPLLLIEGGEYHLHGAGDLADAELVRLAGAKVRIFGVTGDPRVPRGKHVLVERYEITDVGGGVAPRIGWIARIELDGAGKLLFVDHHGNADLLPDGWMKKMEKHVGAKAWMVGERSGSKFQPQRFAILRTAPGLKEEP